MWYKIVPSKRSTFNSNCRRRTRSRWRSLPPATPAWRPWWPTSSSEARSSSSQKMESGVKEPQTWPTDKVKFKVSNYRYLLTTQILLILSQMHITSPGITKYKIIKRWVKWVLYSILSVSMFLRSHSVSKGLQF